MVSLPLHSAGQELVTASPDARYECQEDLLMGSYLWRPITTEINVN